MKIVKKNFIKFTFTIFIFSFLANILLARSKKSKSKNPIAIFDKKTPANDWGNNNIFYLDRHDVACGGQEALQGFKLFRPQGNQLSYEYVCKAKDTSISPNETYEASTDWNSTNWNKKRSANFLDRHDVQCKKGYALQRFRLGRNGNNINYNFRCVKVNCEENQTFETSKTSDGGFETIYLDRQDVRLKTNEVLVGFKLNSKNGFWYKITYCKLIPSIPVVTQLPVNPVPLNPLPVNPVPVTPIPVNQVPVNPLPVNQVPVNPLPVNPLPVNPVPVTPVPVNQVPVTPVPVNQVPVNPAPAANINNNHITPINPTSKQEQKNKVRDFCSINCQYNNHNKNRKCYLDNEIHICKRCTLKATIDDPDKDKELICSNLCNSINGQACDLYGFFNNKLKKISMKILGKYGLKLAKRRLIK